MFLLWFLSLLLPLEAQYDYIVVGSGAAGSVLGARLSEDRSVRVLVIEAGPEDTKFPDLPVFQTDQFYSLLGTAADWGYTATSPATPLKKWNINAGKLAGGSTSINAAMWVQATKNDWDTFASLVGDNKWNWNGILPSFQSIENYVNGKRGDQRGRSGPTVVSNSPNLQPFATTLLNQAANELRWNRIADYNIAPRGTGLTVVQLSSQNNQRFSAYRRFLLPADQARTNLDVIYNSQVEKVLFRGKQAIGVEYLMANGTRANVSLCPKGEVILSAGAIATPQILMLSGVGPAAVLNDLGIPILLQKEGVGLNWQDHIIAPVIYAQAGNFSATTEWVQVMGFETLPGSQRPDLQYFFVGRKDGLPISVSDNLSQASFCLPTLSRPQSRGSMKISSTSIRDKPVINAGYLTSLSDIATLRHGVEQCRAFFKSSAFQSRFPSIEVVPLLTEPIALGTYILYGSSTLWHVAGTAKMGTSSDPLAVVDTNLRVMGLSNLRVVDGSVFPLVPSGNTQVPIMTLAAKAADIIKRTRRN